MKEFCAKIVSLLWISCVLYLRGASWPCRKLVFSPGDKSPGKVTAVPMMKTTNEISIGCQTVMRRTSFYFDSLNTWATHIRSCVVWLTTRSVFCK